MAARLLQPTTSNRLRAAFCAKAQSRPSTSDFRHGEHEQRDWPRRRGDRVTQCNVCFWPIATDRILVAERRFRGTTDMAGAAAGRTRTRMTQSGHGNRRRIVRIDSSHACVWGVTQRNNYQSIYDIFLKRREWPSLGGKLSSGVSLSKLSPAGFAFWHAKTAPQSFR